MTTQIRFAVDPRTNSDDPEQRMAYGLTVVPPWSDGGSLFINFPEHSGVHAGHKRHRPAS